MWERMRAVLVMSLVALATASHEDLSAPLESDDIIQAVNNAKTTWKAGRNFDKTFTKSYIRNLMGLKRRPEGGRLPPLLDDGKDEDLELPASFDAREKWSQCKALQEVRDQGPCGSGWAVAAAAAFQDRLCIATNAGFNGHLSVEDLLSCCSSCGYGCDGGFDDAAWEYLQETGICTGGDYKSKEGCQPYTLPTCKHYVAGPRKNCSSTYLPTPTCQQSCYNKKYKAHTKDQDLHKVKNAFTIYNDIETVQEEIFNNGPLEASFDVYEDFPSYKSGVYQYIKGSYLGNHAVKVIGWGEEGGVPYWLVANSWNSNWGDKGYFKIKKGNNECNFERALNGGYPDV